MVAFPWVAVESVLAAALFVIAINVLVSERTGTPLLADSAAAVLAPIYIGLPLGSLVSVHAIAGRQAVLAPAQAAAELIRLQALLGQTGDLAALNQQLAQRIAAGEIGLDHPGLLHHLWHSTLDKLAVDQPGYDTYRRFTGG